MVKLSYEDMVGRLIPPVVDEPDTALFRNIFDPVPAKLEMDFFQRLVVSLNNHVAGDDCQLVPVTERNPQPRTIEIEMYSRSSAAALEKRSDWSTIEISLACSNEEGLDPFEDDPSAETPPLCDGVHNPDFDSGTSSPSSSERITAWTFLDQIVEHADIVFQRQQRTHYYTLAILGRYARIARWDRSGCVYSDKFDYVAEPAKLALLLWRLSHAATPDVRGHDLSATRVLRGSAEYHAMVQSTTVIAGDHARELFAKSLVDTWPWWKLTVSGGDPKQAPHEYLVAKPTFAAPDVVGRGTRGYVALDYTDPAHPLVYLKDCWRVVHPRSEQEGAILTYLNSKRVGHIPTMLCHGDIGKETVMTRDIWKEVHGAEKECSLKNYRHYRLVVKEVGKPLNMFKNGKQLVWVILHALLAHMHAYTKAHTIHRDISVGNILIIPAPGKNAYGCYGLLTDWEHSKRTDVNYTEARHPDRTGTWQFMSINALCKPTKEIDIPDELESLFHVLLYCSMRWIPHNCADVGAFMYKYFDEGVPVDQEHKEYAASLLKRLVFASGELIAPNNARIVFLKAPQPSLPAVLSPALVATDSGSESDVLHSPTTSRSGTPTPQSRSVPTDCTPAQPVIPKGDRHPIDHLLNDLLPLFKALYEHQKVPFLRPKERPEPELESIEEWVASSGLDTDDLNFLGTPGVDLPDQSEDLVALEKTAKKLEVHDNVAKILFTALSKNVTDYWPAQDKQADQLAPKHVPNQPVKDSAAKSGKRTSLHDGTFEETGRPAVRPRSSTVSRT
ncbi:hypothetical protein VTO73DRAFT_11589 [Trametes versicolor]